MKKPLKTKRVTASGSKKANQKHSSPSKEFKGTLGLLSSIDLPLQAQSSGATSTQHFRPSASDSTSKLRQEFVSFYEFKQKVREPESLLHVVLPSLHPHNKIKSYNAHLHQTVHGFRDQVRDRFANLDELKHTGSLGQSYAAPHVRGPIATPDQRSSMINPFTRKAVPNTHNLRRLSTLPPKGNPMDDESWDPWDDYRHHTDGESMIVMDDDFIRGVDAASTKATQTSSGSRSNPTSSSRMKSKRGSDSEGGRHVVDPDILRTAIDEPELAPLDQKIGKRAGTNHPSPRIHRAHHFIEYSAVSVVPKTDNRASTDTEKVFPHHSMIAGTSNMNRLASMYGSGYLNKRLFDPEEADKYYENKMKEEKTSQKSEVRKQRKSHSTQSESDISYAMHGKRRFSTWEMMRQGLRNFSIGRRNDDDDDSNMGADQSNDKMLQKSMNNYSTTSSRSNDDNATSGGRRGMKMTFPDQLELSSNPTQSTSVEYGYSGFNPDKLVSAKKTTQRGDEQQTVQGRQDQSTSRSRSTSTATSGRRSQLSDSDNERIKNKPRYQPKVQGHEFD